MKSFSFNFTIDSSGSPDAITLPSNFPSGARMIVLKPPTGHSWRFYSTPVVSDPYYQADLDEAITLRRDASAQDPFLADETIGYAALDSGSGTGWGLAS